MIWIEQMFLDFSLQGIWGIVFILFGVVWLMLMLYFWVVFSRLAFYKVPSSEDKKQEKDFSPPVSVVISAKNEAYNLSQFLPDILEQDYPDYEVIVVNDASVDETADILDDMKRKYAHLKVINLYENVNFFKGKKFPLSVGIRSAKHEHLLLTDADCRPAGKLWIRSMISCYNDQTEIVLGYGKYEEGKGLLNKLQRYDTVFTALQYFSFALMGMPYMGVGRNLSYLKRLFKQTRGFSSHYKIKSGDDDLFINKVANKKNTNICLKKESFTISKGIHSIGQWITQKRRHLTTGQYYKPKHKFWLNLFGIGRLLFWITLIALLIRFYNGIYVILAGAVMLFTYLFILKRVMNNLDERKLLFIAPFLDICVLFTYLFISFANQIRKPDKWK
ncbi:MAG: glycosyltransferase [Bacteroidales bacterium]